MNQESKYPTAICQWPKEDRPREKMMRREGPVNRAVEAKVPDHPIIGDGCYYSFSDKGVVVHE
ncbi:MAG: hypothetical protein A3D87_01520 [Omnitrophica WOR_2 bacterium RIFCSPHIGHO2_02_FULL_50_17]|nr:MAG: hypothetical protein A3D87_01520 [Omnitrophica WOR_2 bacterium RIFCSPHIGHO2_02_FULL_50_17]